jgi:hypothetical protein
MKSFVMATILAFCSSYIVKFTKGAINVQKRCTLQHEHTIGEYQAFRFTKHDNLH